MASTMDTNNGNNFFCAGHWTLDHNLAAIYGKKLFSKRKRDAVKFQQLSDLMRTLIRLLVEPAFDNNMEHHGVF
ncbi:hypothetical protein JHK82_017743 [Glycine max]|nr:hypothetical protein JHK82_017743 [Glycine max]